MKEYPMIVASMAYYNKSSLQMQTQAKRRRRRISKSWHLLYAIELLVLTTLTNKAIRQAGSKPLPDSLSDKPTNVGVFEKYTYTDGQITNQPFGQS